MRAGEIMNEKMLSNGWTKGRKQNSFKRTCAGDVDDYLTWTMSVVIFLSFDLFISNMCFQMLNTSREAPQTSTMALTNLATVEAW